VTTSVSVIIPTFNGSKRLPQCLKALAAQDFSGKIEVVVVDDGSTDGTNQLVENEFPNVLLMTQQNQGPAVARNKGARKAQGDIILFTDDDCVPESNWITQMVLPFTKDNKIVGVKGAYKTRQKPIVARFVQLEYEDKYRKLARHRDNIDFIDTYSAGYQRSVFVESGGYDTQFRVACAEDVELSYRLSNAGLKMVFNPDAIVFHTHPDRLRAYIAKKYKFAYWRVLAYRKNPEKVIGDSHTPQMMKFQAMLPPLLILSLLVETLSGGKYYFTGGAVVVLLATTAPFVLRNITRDPAAAILSPLFLVCRAFSQAVGIIRGALSFLLIRAEKNGERKMASSAQGK
jgi:GT2 family glycosyltransferase